MNRDLPQLSAGLRYVFFSSLDQYDSSSIYNTYADYAHDMLADVKEDITLNSTHQSNNRIQYALDFLGSAAQFERAKEIQFFSNFKHNYPEAETVFKINLTNPSQTEYISFIASINTALKGVAAFKKRLDTEINRISRVQSFRKTGDKLKLEYNKNNITQRVNQANKDNLTFFKRGGHSGAKNGSFEGGEKNFTDIFTRNSNMGKFTSTVLQEYGPKLFEYNKNGLNLQPKQIAALIKVITDEAYAIFLSETEVLSNDTLINAREIILGEDFQNFFKDLMNAPGLSDALSDIADQYALGYDKNMSDVSADKIKNLKEDLLYNFQAIKSEIPENMTQQEWLNFIGASNNELKEIYRSILSVSAQAYYTGEDLNLIELVRNKIYASLGGGKNPTDDIYAGKLIIEPDIQFNSGELEARLASIGRRAYKDIKGLKDIDTFFDNADKLREARQLQLQELEKAKETLTQSEEAGNYLLSHVNIHTTIKGYTGVEGSTFTKDGGFSGASFGSSLPLQLNIINQLADSGGFDIGDLNFLQFALINAGSQMIGHYLKSSLEDYFSIFVGFLMFNDAELMFEDVTKWIKDNTISTVNDIHLYELNGVTVPSSFLLENTYQALKVISKDIQSKTNQYGVKATLSTYNGAQIAGAWEETAKKAQSTTKFSIHFLAGFLDILGQIQAAMPH